VKVKIENTIQIKQLCSR